MKQVVYTNYWVNRRNKSRKEHGSYKTEEDAVKAIYTWWEIHKEHHKEVEQRRTNTGALEIMYGDDNYVYRIEKRTINEPLPPTTYRLKTVGEIHAERLRYQLNDETFLFDELAEPYRDRLIVAMADSKKVRDYCYTINGQPIIKLSDIKQLH